MSLPRSFLIYVGASLLLCAWWGTAFHFDRRVPPLTGTAALQPLKLNDDDLSLFKRETLKKALDGDYGLMAALIHEWDIDAQCLQERGLEGIHRLSAENMFKSQLLARKICHQDRPISKKSFLPQTYVAASFLLVLVEPHQIVGLPQGLREQTRLYPSSMTDAVPLTINRYHSEALFLSEPAVAFIAPYSHPSTVEALKNQGIHLFCVPSSDTFEDVCQVLLEIGKTTEESEKAELLKIFMESAMIAVDNRLVMKNHIFSHEKFLYVSHHSTFSLPTKNTLTGYLLMRAGIMKQMETLETYSTEQQWCIPIDQEKIVNFNPSCLIISTENPNGMKRRLEEDSAFTALKGSCHKIAYLDEDIITSPTQYVVLAYYDLAQIMIQ